MSLDATAIVVGIADYDKVGHLPGCDQDAIDCVEWLIDIGVPPGRIHVHASTLTLGVPPTVRVKTATRDAIWQTCGDLLQTKATGEKLFVFLSGHGYFLADSGPIFLCQDYSTTFRSKNLDIHAFVEFFQGLGFTDTLFVVDCCQNYDVDPQIRSAIQANGPDQQGVVAKPKNGLLLLAAAEQEQLAPIIGGRGLLTETLIDQLRAAPSGGLKGSARDTLAFDWKTGDLEIDIAPLFEHSVAPAVTAAAFAAGQRQNPTMHFFGRLAREWRFMTPPTAPIPFVPLSVTAHDLAGLEWIQVSTSPPVRTLELPLPINPPMPFTGFAPSDRRLIANCTPAVDWSAQPPTHLVTTPAPAVALHFDLTKPPPLGGQAVINAPAADFNVKMLDREGAPAFEVTSADYQALFEGLAAPTTQQALRTRGLTRDLQGLAGDAVAGAPTLNIHENGPDIAVNGAPEAAAWLAGEVRDRLTTLVGERHPGASFVVVPPGQLWSRETLPRLQLVLPEGGAKALVGPWLTEAPLVRLERFGRVGDEVVAAIWSAAELERQPWRTASSGDYRLVLAPPWGQAVETVSVGAERARVALPEPPPGAPLRNLVTETDLVRLRLGPAFYAPGQGEVDLDADHAHLRHLPSWPGGTLLVSNAEGLRIEPWSDLPWPEWDRLFTAGRLEVDLRAARARFRGARSSTADIALLALGLAYAAWASADRDALKDFLRLSGAGLDQSTDYQLLALLAADRTSDKAFAPPLLRWGAGLAAQVAPNTEVPGPPLPNSTWALYAQDETRVPEPQYAYA